MILVLGDSIGRCGGTVRAILLKIDREGPVKDLTFTMENYLEAIYELSLDGNGARVSDIAERLGVTKASTNSAMATLADKGLIRKEKYKEVYLTPEGTGGDHIAKASCDTAVFYQCAGHSPRHCR